MYQIWVTPLLAAALVGTASDKRDAPPIGTEPGDTKSETIQLDQDAHARLTVPVKISGAGPFDFMIDTGAQATAVTREINEQLNLEPLGMATLIGMASVRPVEVVGVDNLQMGDRTISNLISPVLERNHVGADGIIGLDSLQDLRVIIDFRKDTISVADASKKEGKKGYEIVVKARRKNNQLLITDAVIDGIRTTVIIDTGAQSSLANNVLRERMRAKRKKEVKTTDVNGVSVMGEVTFAQKVVMQDIALTNIPITFVDTPAFKALGLENEPVLSIGMQHLRMFDRVAIDFSNHQILFDLPRNLDRYWDAGSINYIL